MRKLFFGVICSLLIVACNEKKEEPASATATTASPAADEKKTGDELLPLSEADIVKSSFAAFSKGDIDGMVASYDDNILYTWSGGDSIRGKSNVADYWKKRWTLIDSLTFTEPIDVALMARVQQSAAAPTGKWILHWNLTNAKYKNGKKATFWIHSVNHLNDAGKVDFIGMYYDRAPLNKATEGLTIPK